MAVVRSAVGMKVFAVESEAIEVRGEEVTHATCRPRRSVKSARIAYEGARPLRVARATSAGRPRSATLT